MTRSYTHPPNNHEGDSLGPLEKLITDDINRNRSHRHGTHVYYDPRDRGPYVDGQDALADVPDNGTITIAATDYDVATEGRLSTTRALTIEGEGWDKRDAGSRVVNTGADAVDSPPVEFDGSATGDEAPTVRYLAVDHEGPNSPAVRVNDMTHPRVESVVSILNGLGQDGISIEGNSFYSVVEHSWVNGHTRRGISNTAVGSAHVVRDSHAVSNAPNNPDYGLYSTAIQTYVSGGEWATPNAVGAKLNGDASYLQGGNFESSAVGIEVGESGGANPSRVRVARPRLHLDSLSTGVRFANCYDATVFYPDFDNAGAGGTGYVWESGASAAGAIHNGGGDKAAPLTNNGANNPFVYYPIATTDAVISAITTEPGVDIGVAMATDHESVPAVYDGSAATWKHLASATTAFTP